MPESQSGIVINLPFNRESDSTQQRSFARHSITKHRQFTSSLASRRRLSPLAKDNLVSSLHGRRDTPSRVIAILSIRV